MKCFFYILLALTVISCNTRHKERAKTTLKEAQNTVSEESGSLKNSIVKFAKRKAKDTFDKVYPIFNPDVADTKYNKKRFREFIKVPLTKDVKNIFCYNDDIGIDVDYMFAFSCNKTTADAIIEQHQLKKTNQTDRAFGLQNSDFDWWKKERIKELPFYKNDTEPYIYFWFDQTRNKAYFFEFTL